jgi:hypothetical protein
MDGEGVEELEAAMGTGTSRLKLVRVYRCGIAETATNLGNAAFLAVSIHLDGR